MARYVLITGGFDPIHSGHIEYLKSASDIGDFLYVGVNSDDWLTRKKGRPFMHLEERRTILSSIWYVDEVFSFDDSDGSACDAIAKLLAKIGDDDILVFANGGDRTSGNIPEIATYGNHPSVRFEFGVGGDTKINSSSSILSEWKNPRTERGWGYYRVLHSDGPGTKVKELTVRPRSSLSLQMHEHRSEYWFVSHGVATLNDENGFVSKHSKHEMIVIPVGSWHQLVNDSDDELRIVEIQYGTLCSEEDIVRSKT